MRSVSPSAPRPSARRLGRRGRPRRRLTGVALLAAALLSIAAVVSPAAAAVGGGIGTGDTTGTGVVGGATSGTKGVGVTSTCGPTGNGGVNGAGYLGGQRLYLSPFPRCYDPGAIYLGNPKVCQVGYEVYRFYSDANPNDSEPIDVRAYTVSDVTLEHFCGAQPDSSHFTFLSPNASDNATPALGTSFRRTQGMAPDGIPTQPVYWWAAGNLQDTTTMPFDTSGSCTTIENPGTTPEARALANDLYHLAHLKLYNTYQSQKQQWGAMIARTIVDVTGITPATATGFNRLPPCSSGLQFQPDKTSTHLIWGTCYIPLMADLMTFQNERTGTTEWGFLDAQPGTLADPGVAVRYSTAYGQRRGYAVWRTTIKNDRMKRGAYTAGDFQVAMHHPYAAFTGNGTGPTSVAAAAQQAANDAVCVKGQKPAQLFNRNGGSIPGKPAPTTTTPPPPSTTTTTTTTPIPPPQPGPVGAPQVQGDINVTGPDVGQIGGTLRPMTFNVSAYPLLNKVAALAERSGGRYGQLTHLSYLLTFTGKNGYRHSEWVETDQPTITSLQFQQSAKVIAYRATMPNQYLNVSLRDISISATYQVHVARTRTVLRRRSYPVCHTKHHRTHCVLHYHNVPVPQVYYVWVTRPLQVSATYTYNGRPFNPGAGKNLKIIGTTAVPGSPA